MAVMDAVSLANVLVPSSGALRQWYASSYKRAAAVSDTIERAVPHYLVAQMVDRIARDENIARHAENDPVVAQRNAEQRVREEIRTSSGSRAKLDTVVDVVFRERWKTAVGATLNRASRRSGQRAIDAGMRALAAARERTLSDRMRATLASAIERGEAAAKQLQAARDGTDSFYAALRVANNWSDASRDLAQRVEKDTNTMRAGGRSWDQTYAQWRDTEVETTLARYPHATRQYALERAKFIGEGSGTFLRALEDHNDQGGAIDVNVWDDTLRRLHEEIGQDQALRWFLTMTRGVHERTAPKNYIVPWMRKVHEAEKRARRKPPAISPIRAALGWEYLRDLHELGRKRHHGERADYFTLMLNDDNRPVTLGLLSIDRPHARGEGFTFRMTAIHSFDMPLSRINAIPTISDRLGSGWQYTPFDSTGLWKGRAYMDHELQAKAVGHYFERWGPKSTAPIDVNGGLAEALTGWIAERQR